MGTFSSNNERTESAGFYEMLWDCDHCDAKGLLGKSQRHCPNCGAPQNPDKRYFPKEGEERRVDGHKFEGSDRHCPACNAPMASAAKNCSQCGSPLDGSNEVRGIASTPAKKPAPRGKLWPIFAVLAAIIFLTWWFFIRTKAATLVVSGHRWERAVAVEKYGDYSHEAWRNQVPPGDIQGPLLCSRKERSKKQVPDGEDCRTEKVDRKDGTFEMVKKCTPKYRNEPVEDDWCVYTIRTWEKASELTSKGTGMDAKWADGAPPADTRPAMGALRSGARTEKLFLGFGKKGECEVSDAKWRKYKDGESVKMEVRARSEKLVCESL